MNLRDTVLELLCSLPKSLADVSENEDGDYLVKHKGGTCVVRVEGVYALDVNVFTLGGEPARDDLGPCESCVALGHACFFHDYEGHVGRGQTAHVHAFSPGPYSGTGC